MTPDTQARAGYRRPQVGHADSGTAIRSGQLAAEAARTGERGAVPRHAADPPLPQTEQRATRPRMVARAARHAREDASIAKVIPLLAVMVVTVAGIYIAWDKGSAGGGEGGVVAGTGLVGAAVARLLLPAKLVGLLATRKRAVDVVTLAIFGGCLLVAGLVLPG
jgi:Protein of unknown function (DUF3017)